MESGYFDHEENLKTYGHFVFEIFNKILLGALGILLSIYSRLANSTVKSNPAEIELIHDVIVILVTSKNEEDPIKIEGARVPTTLNIDFSDTQGQLTPKS